MKEQVIFLEPHDDAISARDKLGWIRAERVLLVLPGNSEQPLLHAKLDLVLLQREATRRSSELALITRDPIVIEHGREVGIPCFPSVEASHGRFWKTAKAKLAVDRHAQPVPLGPELAEAATLIRDDETKIPQHVRLLLNRGLFISVLAIMAGVVVLVVPTATVHLDPIRNQETVSTTVMADPASTQIEVAQGTIPARLVGEKVNASATVETTGTADIPSTKAHGRALFTNLIPDQITIPSGTIVRTTAASPIRFVTMSDATLPGKAGQTVLINIEAIEPGFEGNLPSNRINEIEGPLGTRIAVTNPEPTLGGNVETVRAISQADHDRVHALVIQQLQQRAFAEMQTDPFVHLVDTEFIPPESLTVVLVDAETYSGYVGQPIDKLDLTMNATVQGTAIDERSARQVVYAKLAEKIGPGFQIGASSLVFKRGEVTNFDDQRRVTFVMEGTGDISVAIQPEDVQDMVHGQTTDAASALLQQRLSLAGLPRITVWPGFWPLLPFLSVRIHVEIEGQP